MYLFGASGHAKVIMDILKANAIEVKGFYDDDTTKKALQGVPVIGHTDDHTAEMVPCIISIGDNRVRKKVVKRIAVEAYASAIHPGARLSPSVKIGMGTVVMAGVILNADSMIGDHVIINTAASIDHDCQIADYCHIAPNSTLCGGVAVGEGTLIGAGAVVIPNVSIGRWATIGAGAIVTRDIPDFCLAVGNPVRLVKKENVND